MIRQMTAATMTIWSKRTPREELRRNDGMRPPFADGLPPDASWSPDPAIAIALPPPDDFSVQFFYVVFGRFYYWTAR
jgi:hypothetical protein